jgi:hypothetical protein
MYSEINFDVVAKPKKDEIQFIGTPRQYRSNCQTGQFTIGRSRNVGKKILMEVIAARFIEDSLFGYERQKWVSIIFADANRVVSSILIKTESMENFLEMYREAIGEGKSLVTLQIEASMAGRTNKKGSFFAVEFKVNGEGKYTRSIESFRSSLPQGLYATSQEDAEVGDGDN